jgi:hypothetical protein
MTFSHDVVNKRIEYHIDNGYSTFGACKKVIFEYYFGKRTTVIQWLFEDYGFEFIRNALQDIDLGPYVEGYVDIIRAQMEYLM